MKIIIDIIMFKQKVIIMLLILQIILSDDSMMRQKISLPPSFTKFNTDINPPDLELVVLSQQQYHFVNLGSYFQYSLSSFQFQFDSAFLSYLTVQYKLKFVSNNPIYNFIVLDSASQQSPSSLSCYLRAINEGLSSLMEDCFPEPPENPQGTCSQMLTDSAANNFQNQKFFSNCSDLSFGYNITVSCEDKTHRLNSTLLFLIDNSNLFPTILNSTSLINVILSYRVIANVNDANKAKLFLICSLTGVVIVIMIVFAAALNCKIRRLDKEIKEVKSSKRQ